MTVAPTKVAPKLLRPHVVAIISTLVLIALSGCAAKPIVGRAASECTPTTENSFLNSKSSDSPYDMSFAVRLDESPDDVYALISNHENMKEWISVIDESWVEEVTSNVQFFGDSPDLTRSWRIGEHVFTEDVRYWPPDTRTLLYSLNIARSETVLSLIEQAGALVVDPCLEGGSVLRWWQFFDEGSRTAGQSPSSNVPHLSVSQILNGLISRFGGHRL